MLLTFIREEEKYEVDTESSIITKYRYNEIEWSNHVTECSYNYNKLLSVDEFLYKVMMHDTPKEVPQSWKEEVQRYIERDLLE